MTVPAEDLAQRCILRHVPERGRVELDLDGDLVAWARYEVIPGSGAVPTVWAVTSTVTVPRLRNLGLASAVVEALVDAAAVAGARVRPVCPYVAVWLRRHPERHAVVG